MGFVEVLLDRPSGIVWLFGFRTPTEEELEIRYPSYGRRLIEHSISYSPGLDRFNFELQFDRPPDFKRTDSHGRQFDSFQPRQKNLWENSGSGSFPSE